MQDEEEVELEVTELADQLLDLSRFAAIFDTYNGLRPSALVKAHQAPILGELGSEGNPRLNQKWWSRPEDIRLNYLESVLKCPKDVPLEKDDEWLAIAPPSVLWDCVIMHLSKRCTPDQEALGPPKVNEADILAMFDMHADSSEEAAPMPLFQEGVHIWCDNWMNEDDGYKLPTDTITSAPRVEYYVDNQFSQDSASPIQLVGLELSHETADRVARSPSNKQLFGDDDGSDDSAYSGGESEYDSSSDDDANSVELGEDDSPVKKKRKKSGSVQKKRTSAR